MSSLPIASGTSNEQDDDSPLNLFHAAIEKSTVPQCVSSIRTEDHQANNEEQDDAMVDSGSSLNQATTNDQSSGLPTTIAATDRQESTSTTESAAAVISTGSSSSTTSTHAAAASTTTTSTLSQDDDNAISADAINAAAVEIAVHMTNTTANNPAPQPTTRSNNIKRAYAIPVEDGSSISQVDIVLGRGGLANNHPGNKALLQRIKDLQVMFKKYSDMDKLEKNESTRLVADWIKERGGRFLKLDAEQQVWKQVDERQCWNKIMHMFRDDHSTEGRARKRLKYNKNKQGNNVSGNHMVVASDTTDRSAMVEEDRPSEGTTDTAGSSSNAPSAIKDKAVAKVSPDDLATTTQISDKDVLFGRGGHANNNIGNQRLLEYIKSKQAEYKAFGTSEGGKKHKKELTLQVVDWVRNQGGRFLKRDHKDGQWEETTLRDARLKVSQLFRNDHTPEGRLRKRKKYSTETSLPTRGNPQQQQSQENENVQERSPAPQGASNNDDCSSPRKRSQLKLPVGKKSNQHQEPSLEGKMPAAAAAEPATNATTALLDLSVVATATAYSVSVAAAGTTKNTPCENEAAQGSSSETCKEQPPQVPATTNTAVAATDASITNITLPDGSSFPPTVTFPMPQYNQYYPGVHPAAAAAAASLAFSGMPPCMTAAAAPPMMNYPAGAENSPYTAAQMSGVTNVAVGQSGSSEVSAAAASSVAVAGIFTDKDILLGRGGHANHHPGNKMLLDRVKQLQPAYKRFGGEENGKKQKNIMTRELVEWVQSQGGRFLKREHKLVPWKEVSFNEARMKVSHLFRNDHTPEGRKRKRKKYAAPKFALPGVEPASSAAV